MAWGEATIADTTDADRASNLIRDQTAAALLTLAAAGRLQTAEGAVIWSKLDLQTLSTTFLFNEVAMKTFPALALALGAQEVQGRKVKIGMQEYGRLFSYGDGNTNDEDTSDMFG